MKQIIKPPRSLIDAHTLLAQKYAGYLVGHPYQNTQQRTEVTVDWAHSWREPSIVADDCIFCQRLTDEEAERRIAGFQFQINTEVLRSKRAYFKHWCRDSLSDVPEPGKYELSQANVQRFCELFQDRPTEKRPDGWFTRPFPLITLPMRLKRKLCIEWNHLYLAWMKENAIWYDFGEHEFYHEVDEETQAKVQSDKEWEQWRENFSMYV